MRQYVLGLLIAVMASTVYAKEVNLVLLRHGESQFNLEKRFAGWSDTPLTEKGIQQAKTAGYVLAGAGVVVDSVHTSLLDRAIDTAWLATQSMGKSLPQYRYWRLNERHYGGLEGKTHQEVMEIVGEDQVKIWRRSFDVPPPALPTTDPRSPTKNSRYSDIPASELPVGESMKDTIKRVEHYWKYSLKPTLAKGDNIMVVAHSNSLKALSSWVEPHLSPKEIVSLEIPNAVPVIYRLDFKDDGSFTVLNKTVLGSVAKGE